MSETPTYPPLPAPAGPESFIPLETDTRTNALEGYLTSDQTRNTTPQVTRVTLIEANWAQLNDVNRRVNAAIAYTPDEVTYGRSEYAANPLAANSRSGRTADGRARGDCEDYAIAKRDALIEAGWPSNSLSLAFATAPGLGAHAVLMARTDRGDLVLDNDTDRSNILLYNQTPYLFNAVQAGSSADMASVVHGPDTTTRTPLAGTDTSMTFTRRPSRGEFEIGIENLHLDTSDSVGSLRVTRATDLNITTTDQMNTQSYRIEGRDAAGNLSSIETYYTLEGHTGVSYYNDNGGRSMPLPQPDAVTREFTVYNASNLTPELREQLNAMRETAAKIGVEWNADWTDGTIEIPSNQAVSGLALEAMQSKTR